MKKGIFFLVSLFIVFSCGKNEDDNLGLENNKFQVMRDTASIRNYSTVHYQEDTQLRYYVALGQHNYFASVEKLSGNFNLFLNSQEIVSSLIIDYKAKENVLFRITPTSKNQESLVFRFSLYNETKEFIFTDTVRLLNQGVNFSVKSNQIGKTTLSNTDSNREGRFLFHGQTFGFTIESKEYDNFKVHIENLPPMFGDDIYRPRYHINGKQMPANGLFDFTFPPVPSTALTVNAGSHTITTLSGRYAYSPFDYSKGSSHSDKSIKVWVVNSAGMYKTINWEFNFQDPGGYNPG